VTVFAYLGITVTNHGEVKRGLNFGTVCYYSVCNVMFQKSNIRNVQNFSFILVFCYWEVLFYTFEGRMRFVMGTLAVGQVFVQVLYSSCDSIIPPMLHTHVSFI
jgi:hypothetical protein